MYGGIEPNTQTPKTEKKCTGLWDEFLRQFTAKICRIAPKTHKNWKEWENSCEKKRKNVKKCLMIEPLQWMPYFCQNKGLPRSCWLFKIIKAHPSLDRGCACGLGPTVCNLISSLDHLTFPRCWYFTAVEFGVQLVLRCPTGLRVCITGLRVCITILQWSKRGLLCIMLDNATPTDCLSFFPSFFSFHCPFVMSLESLISFYVTGLVQHTS